MAESHGTCRGVNTFGDPIRSHIDVINEQHKIYVEIMESVRRYLDGKNLKGQHADWDKKSFAFLMIKPYCRGYAGTLVPAEFSVVVFSFHEGVKEVHSGFFNVGYDKIPFGEKGEVRLVCDMNGYPVLGEKNVYLKPGEKEPKELGSIAPSKFMIVVETLAKKYGLFMDEKLLLFTTRADNPIIRCCLDWIQQDTDRTDEIQLVSFEILLKEMSGKMDPPDAIGVIHHEGGAGRFIYHPRYDFQLYLGCPWHKYTAKGCEKIDRCANSIAMRRVYNALFYLCHLFGKPLTIPSHVPPEGDSKGSVVLSVEKK